MAAATNEGVTAKKLSPFEQTAYVGKVKVHGVARTSPYFLNALMTPLYRCTNVGEVLFDFYFFMYFFN